MHALLGVAALLRAQHQHFAAAEARHAADHRRVVAKTAVAVNFAEVGEDALDVIQRIGTAGMARQFGALPGSQLAGHLPAERRNPVMQYLQLLLGILIVSGSGLQLLNLTFDAFQLLLRFRNGFHIGAFPAGRGLDHRLDRADPEIQGGQHSSLRRRELGFVGHGSI